MGKLYASGCYGTGNLGDDAIFEGLYKKYCNEYEVIQVYLCQPTHARRVQLTTLMNNGFEKDTERFIIGGGGLFFDMPICDDMNKVADIALKNNIEVTIEGVGLETAKEECYPGMKTLFEKCSKIGLRSEESRRIAKNLGFDSEFSQDFAHYIEPDDDGALAVMPILDENLPIIGIVTANGIDAYMNEPIALCKRLLDKFNVIHIPHLRHLMSPRGGNEAAKGLIIWSSLGWIEPEKFKRFRCLPFPNSPQILLGIYQLLDGVISYRYHPLIFSKMTGTKCYARYWGKKVESFFEDNPELNWEKDDVPMAHDKEKLDRIFNYFLN